MGNKTDELEALRRRSERERRARQAEHLLEKKSQELFATNNQLLLLTRSLEAEIGVKTRELLNAQRVAGLGTLIWDIQAELVTWSEGVYHVLGRDPQSEPLSFEHYVAAIHEEDRAAFLDLLNGSVAAGLDPDHEYKARHRIVCPNGDIRWVQCRGVASLDDRDEVRYLFGTVQDVTAQTLADDELQRNRRIAEQRVVDLERAQDQLAKARDAAEQANRTKSRFLAMMSHEVRTPINGVLGALTLLRDTDLEDSQRELLRLAVSSAEALRVVLNDVIDISKLEAGHLKLEIMPFDLHEIVRATCDFWRPLAAKNGIELKASLEDDVPQYVRGDPARIRQVLNNFVSNAIKFTREGSIRVGLSLDVGEPPPDANQVRVRIEVDDTGIGISKEDQGGLFKEFSQVGDTRVGERGGAGLGLAISRELANRMQGSVGVTSAPRIGSTFWFRFPLEVTEAPADQPDERRALPKLQNAAGEPPRILLAEDVPANQMVAQLMLQGFGCRVDLAANGLEAVNAATSRPYDAVLMDVAMPELDGVEATRQICRLEGDAGKVPIIGLTAFAMAEDHERFRNAGMSIVLSKPLNRDALYDTVRASLSGKPRPPARAPADPEVGAFLDPAVLREMTASFSAEQVAQLMDRLVIDIETHATAATEHARQGAVDGLGQSCHALKGLAASFGSYTLADMARHIEQQCREGDGEAAMAMALSDLDAVCAGSLDALRQYSEPDASVRDAQ